jgi:hypothetical protein
MAAAKTALQMPSAAADMPPVPEGLQRLGQLAAARQRIIAGATDDTLPVRASARGKSEVSHPSRSPLTKHMWSTDRSRASSCRYLGTAGITLALAICGGIIAAARRFSARGSVGGIRIVSRANLSQKHTVYLLQVGRRLLLVGTGPQGAPSLIGEIDDSPEIEPNPHQGEDG